MKMIGRRGPKKEGYFKLIEMYLMPTEKRTFWAKKRAIKKWCKSNYTVPINKIIMLNTYSIEVHFMDLNKFLFVTYQIRRF